MENIFCPLLNPPKQEKYSVLVEALISNLEKASKTRWFPVANSSSANQK